MRSGQKVARPNHDGIGRGVDLGSGAPARRIRATEEREWLATRRSTSCRGAVAARRGGVPRRGRSSARVRARHRAARPGRRAMAMSVRQQRAISTRLAPLLMRRPPARLLCVLAKPTKKSRGLPMRATGGVLESCLTRRSLRRPACLHARQGTHGSGVSPPTCRLPRRRARRKKQTAGMSGCPAGGSKSRQAPSHVLRQPRSRSRRNGSVRASISPLRSQWSRSSGHPCLPA